MGTQTPQRSDWWAGTNDAEGNPWAVASVAFAALGLVALGVIVAGMYGEPSFDSLPDAAASALYGSVPGFGVLALLAGLTGRTRRRRTWMAWTGVIMGSVLLALAVVGALILLNAFLTLG